MKKFGTVLLAAVAVSALAATAVKAEIKIATAGPMTGQYASFGEQMRRGAEMAVADINAAGGVLGQQLQLSIGDDACDPKQAVAVANKMVSDGVVFMAGHFCSGSSIPASQVYTEEGILQISPASTNPKLTDEGGDNVFRVCGRDDQQGIVAGDMLADKFGKKKIAILHDKTAYGKGLADETMKQLNKRGVKEAMYEAYTAGEKDYSAIISKMKAAGIDVFYLGGYHTEAGLMVRQAREQGYGVQLVSGDALVTDEYWKITGDAGEGTLMTFSPDPRKNPVAKPVVENFRKGGYEPEGYTLYTYGAIQAWAQAVEKAESTDTNKVIAALRGNKFETVLGNIGFDQKGDVTAPGYVWYEWSKGTYDYLKAMESAAALGRKRRTRPGGAPPPGRFSWPHSLFWPSEIRRGRPDRRPRRKAVKYPRLFVRSGPGRRLLAAAAALGPGPLAAQPDLLGEFGALLGVVGRHHRIVRRQTPLCPILVGCQIVSSANVPLQHLQLLAVLEADDVVGCHRAADRHRRLRRLGLRLAGAALQPAQRLVHGADDLGNLRGRQFIIADIGGNNLRRHAKDVFLANFFLCLFVHCP